MIAIWDKEMHVDWTQTFRVMDIIYPCGTDGGLEGRQPFLALSTHNQLRQGLELELEFKVKIENQFLVLSGPS